MSPMQHELYASTVLAERRREADRFHPTGGADRAWRDRLGVALVGVGDRLRATGRRLQSAPDAPAGAPCAGA